MKQDFRTVHIRIDTDVYEALSGLVNPKAPSISFVIRQILRDNVGGVKIVSEVKPLQNLQNPKEGLDLPISTPIFGGERSVIDRSIGIDYKAVGIAMRNKRRGLPYDKSLEPYFNA